MTYSKQQILGLAFLLCLPPVARTQEQAIPFRVMPLFQLDQPETLGLPSADSLKTISIFKPNEDDNKYNHGVVLFPFKGMLYAQWQSSAIDEDGADTRVFYSRSPNGEDWAKPTALTEENEHSITTSGGWWSNGDTLAAYINNWPNQIDGVKSGYTTYLLSTDGIRWEPPQPVTDRNGQQVPGIIEQDVRALPGGRLLTAFHRQPGLIATPFFTNDRLGISGWTAGVMQNLPNEGPMSREIEPSWFYRKDSAIVMIFRDQLSTFKKLASISRDEGATWATPVLVNTPDSRAKQSAGNLPDGTAFMVNNPSGNKSRIPLVITLSKDGFIFDKAFLVRSGGIDLQPQRFAGKYKRAGYSYPKSVLWGDCLYIGYATNKEDVELTRIPIDVLEYKQK